MLPRVYEMDKRDRDNSKTALISGSAATVGMFRVQMTANAAMEPSRRRRPQFSGECGIAAELRARTRFGEPRASNSGR